MYFDIENFDNFLCYSIKEGMGFNNEFKDTLTFGKFI